MESVQEFETRLSAAVNSKRKELDSRQLPQLSKDLQMMLTASNTVSQALAKKSVFHNSSIRYDDKIDDIVPPSSEYIPEGREKIYVIGTRFGQYIAMLEHVVQHYQFNTVFLTPPRISKLTALLRTFEWNNLSTSSENLNTRAFAEVIQEFKRSGDSFAINIVTNSITQLAEQFSASIKTLKNLSAFQREAYKLNVRSSIMPKVGLPEGAPPDNDSLKAIKKVFAQHMHGAPFYTDLIKEILSENSGPSSDARREDVLARLNAEDEAQKRKKQDAQVDYRAMLVDALRVLGTSAQQLVLIINRLSENLRIYQASQETFFSKLKELFRIAFKMPAKEVVFTINIVNPAGQGVKRETIHFNSFTETLKKKARLMNAFSDRASPAWRKLDAMTDQQLFDVLSSNISDMNTILKQCGGVDEYFKSEAKGDAKGKTRGIKIEMSAIQNTIHKANKLRAEYAGQVEEKEQLKRLGIG